MKQILQRRGQITVEDVPAPALQPGFVLVRTIASVVSAGTERAATEVAQRTLLQRAIARPVLVRQVLEQAAASGLSATVESVRNHLDEPVQLGYSAAGTVIHSATDASTFKAGDLVACAGAGFANHAEVICVPKNLCVRVPEGVSAEDAAFSTVGAIALHGARLARLEAGATIAVIGLGLVGQIAAQIASASGCRVLGIDLQRHRVDLAQQLGVQAVDTRDSIVALATSVTGGVGVDAVLVTADTKSSDPIELAGELARDRAMVVAIGAVGMTVPRPAYYAKELQLVVSRSYGPGRYDADYEIEGHDYPIGYVRWTENRNLSAFLDFIARGLVRVRPLITHRFPITAACDAYEIVSGRVDTSYLGVVMEYSGTPLLTQTIGRGVESGAPVGPGTNQPRVGVLGTGNFARGILLPALKAAGVRMVGIVGRQGLNAKVCADRFGFDYFGTDEAKVFADPDVDVIVVATRHDRHARQVLAAAEAGKDVFVEKPLCLTATDLETIQDAFSTPGAPRLMVGFNRRFAPLAVQLKDFFKDGGQPLMATYRVNAGRVPLDHWVHDPKEGGGRIVGEACHFVDFLGWLTDAKPLTVTAQSLSGDITSDNMVIVITYANGSVGTVVYTATGDPSGGKERVEVHGGGGSAILDDFRELELRRGKQRKTVRHRFAQNKGHREECAAFINAVRRGERSPIPLDQIVATTLITFLALESARSGATMSVRDGHRDIQRER